MRLFILSADTLSTMSRTINPSYVKAGICVSTGKRDAFILLMRMQQTQRKLVFVTILSTLLITVSKRKQVKNIFYN